MHSQRKTFNSPSEISIVSRQSSFSFSFFTQSLNHFHLSRQVSRTKSRRSILWSVKHFHAKKEEKREKCKSLRCFVLRTFFSFFAKSRSCFVSKLLKNEEKYFVCDFIHNSADWWKSSTLNPTCSLPSARSKNKHIISFLVAKCNKVDFYVSRLNGIRFLVFLSRNELRARRFLSKIQILPVLLIVFFVL